MPTDKLPDIAVSTKAQEPANLSWVGMSGISMPLKFHIKGEKPKEYQTLVDCSVNLTNPKQRGIHMSRMYLSLVELSKLRQVDYPALAKFSKSLVASQQGSSNSSLISFSFDMLVKRPSLVSKKTGWLSYPVKITLMNARGKISCQLDFQLLYSSTCPCSAALARQLISERFAKNFGKVELTTEKVAKWLLEEDKAMAIPHSQRSQADIKVQMKVTKQLPLLELIDKGEASIKTAVQTVVKREDEQRFSSINGENLMFCEDAARILLDALDTGKLEGIKVRVSHLESLHPQNAVAEVTKGKLINPA